MVRFLLGAAALLSVATPARATYSIVATDSATGQVGGAGTSCVGTLDVHIIYGGAPGFGAAHAQAFVNEDGRDRAAELLGQGYAPDEVIADITSDLFDPRAADRQYGVVDLEGRAAAHTGADNVDYAAHSVGHAAPYTYSVQGNMITSHTVIASAEAAFLAGGCDLAERLFTALEAGARDGEGDNRCTPNGMPSSSGFIHVDAADGSELLHLSVTSTALFTQNPLPELRQQFDAWRAENPCPEPVPDAGDGGDGDGAGEGGCGCAAPGFNGARGVGLLGVVLAIALRLRRRARSR